MYRLPRRMVDETFSVLRSCGAGKRECKLYWASSWAEPSMLTQVIHPRHRSSFGGVILDNEWISRLWAELADQNLGVRVQVHTHPGKAFHSKTDDDYPLVHEAGFLSLVIPDFALGPVGFEQAYLTEIQPDGSWRQVAIEERLAVDD